MSFGRELFLIILGGSISNEFKNYTLGSILQDGIVAVSFQDLCLLG